jgi:hypothetical protein
MRFVVAYIYTDRHSITFFPHGTLTLGDSQALLDWERSPDLEYSHTRYY